MTLAIEIHDMHFGWSRLKPLLHIPEFRVESGERLFLQGPSGCGKSTLLGLIGGVLLPERGSLSVLGTDLDLLRGAMRDRFRADHIGFVFQQFNLLPFLGVADNVLLPCHFSRRRKIRATEFSGSPRNEALRLLRALELDDDAISARSVGELSVGQQQRVAVARALIGGPEILIADEPTSALDESTRLAFLGLLLAECYRHRTTLLFVSHDSTLATLFDRRLTMAQVQRSTALKTAA